MNKKLSIIILLSCVGNIFSMNESIWIVRYIKAMDESDRKKIAIIFGRHASHRLPYVPAASASCAVKPSNYTFALAGDSSKPSIPEQLPVSSSHNQKTKDALPVRFFCLGGGQNYLDEAPSCLKDLGANLPSDCHVSSESSDLNALYTFTADANKLFSDVVAFMCTHGAPSKKEQIENLRKRISQLNLMSECFGKLRVRDFASKTGLKALVTCTDDISKLSGETKALLSIVNEAQLREQSKKEQRETAIRNALEAQTQAKFEHDSAKIKYDEARETVQEFGQALVTNTTNGLSERTFGRQFAEAQQIASAAQQKLLATSLSLETANEDVKKANSRQ